MNLLILTLNTFGASEATNIIGTCVIIQNILTEVSTTYLEFYDGHSQYTLLRFSISFHIIHMIQLTDSFSIKFL